MDYYRIGYAMNPALSTMNAQAVRQLTHLNLAFGRIEKGAILSNGSVRPDMKSGRRVNPGKQQKKWHPVRSAILTDYAIP